MKRLFAALIFCAVSLPAIPAWAEPGELWEVTSKTEMQGMPFAMPSATQQVCIKKGSANDPRQSTSDKECQITDVRQSGNKTTWKARCNHDGEIMNGSGEQTTSANSYQGVVHLEGKSEGENINMTMHFSGKNLGQSCDASAVDKRVAQAKAQSQEAIAQMCDVSRTSSDQLVAMSDSFLKPNAPCADKRTAYCSKVRADAGKNVDTFGNLKLVDKDHVVSKACGIDMAAVTTSVCKTLNGKNYKKLSRFCPAEAKAYRVAMRKKECEGRSYTSGQSKAEGDRLFKDCMSGTDSESAGDNDEGSSSSASKSIVDNPAGAAIEGVKKLKGMFGF